MSIRWEENCFNNLGSNLSTTNTRITHKINIRKNDLSRSGSNKKRQMKKIKKLAHDANTQRLAQRARSLTYDYGAVDLVSATEVSIFALLKVLESDF